MLATGGLLQLISLAPQDKIDNYPNGRKISGPNPVKSSNSSCTSRPKMKQRQQYSIHMLYIYKNKAFATCDYLLEFARQQYLQNTKILYNDEVSFRIVSMINDMPTSIVDGICDYLKSGGSDFEYCVTLEIETLQDEYIRRYIFGNKYMYNRLCHGVDITEINRFIPRSSTRKSIILKHKFKV